MDAVGYNSALPLFVLFAIRYTGLDNWYEKKWVRVLLFLIPLSNIMLITTNELHGWVWQGFSPVKGMSLSLSTGRDLFGLRSQGI